MKKILSVFAAAALLFGFASCSGDLHDVSAVDLSALQLKGSIFTWDNDDAYKLTPDADGTYYREMKLETDKNNLVMRQGTDITDTFVVKVTFPKSNYTNVEYADLLEYIKIDLSAKQLIE